MTAADGNQVSARACVLTVPIGVIGTIDFTTPLPARAAHVAVEGHSSQGFKLWIRARGVDEPFIAIDTGEEPLSLMQWEHVVGDEFVAFSFGLDARKHPPRDLETVTDLVPRLMADLEITDFATHHCVGDPYATETWAMLRPNQLAGVSELATMPGRVAFAGADFSLGWCSFIVAEIENALRTARSLTQRFL